MKSTSIILQIICNLNIINNLMLHFTNVSIFTLLTILLFYEVAINIKYNNDLIHDK